MIRTLFLLTAAFMLALASCAHVMTRPLEHNEQMYVACSVLMIDHQIYEDFAFVQMPLIPIIYSAAYQIFDTTEYLLISRWLTWVFLMCGYGAILWICWLLRRSLAIGVAAAWWLALSETVVIASGECSNYVLPMASSLVSLGLWIKSVREGSRWTGVYQSASGFFVGIAVLAKLYYAAVVVPFLALWLVARIGSQPSDNPMDSEHVPAMNIRSLRCSALPFAIGLSLGLVPAIYFYFRASDQFLFNNILFHLKTAEWYESLAYPDRMTLFERLQYAKSWIQDGSHISILLVSLVLTVSTVLKSSPTWSLPKTVSVLALSLVVVSCAAALSPIPAWPQYFAMPVPFGIVFVISMSSNFTGIDRRWSDRLIMCGLLVSLWVTGPYYVRSTLLARESKNWTPKRMHQEAEKLRTDIVGRTGGASGYIATLAPIHVLEAGLDIFPELSTGPFLYHIGESLSPEERDRYVATSSGELRSMLDARSPVGFWLGFESGPAQLTEDLEAEFRRVATELGYERRDKLWVRTRDD